ncbi:MAG: SWIM zinc finger family protein [Methanoregula sp.]|nr:SWIM zinc finger family protein [Methanoregula sp.]
MSRWGQWYPPARPIAVKNGIQTRSKKGNIGETWWSKRFISALERIGIGSRLERGRAYARKGQVVSINIRDATIYAQVQGTKPRPYNITISFTRFNDLQWAQIFDALSSQALFTAMLLGGEIPQEIETVFTSVNLSLLPTSAKDIKTDCDCPDFANPCKHIAAVYYILAEQFDRDPFLIFSLRGRDREAVLENLRKLRSTSAPVETEAEAPEPESPAVQETDGCVLAPLSECVDSFWDAAETLDTFPIHLHKKPELEAAALKRLGPSLFRINNKDIADLLVPVYSHAREYVLGELRRLESKPEKVPAADPKPPITRGRKKKV